MLMRPQECSRCQIRLSMSKLTATLFIDPSCLATTNGSTCARRTSTRQPRLKSPFTTKRQSVVYLSAYSGSRLRISQRACVRKRSSKKAALAGCQLRCIKSKSKRALTPLLTSSNHKLSLSSPPMSSLRKTASKRGLM